MQKQNKIIILVLVLVAVLVSVVLLTGDTKEGEVNNDTPPIVNNDNNEVANEDESDLNLEANEVPMSAQIDVPEDVNWQMMVAEPDFVVEFMNEEEKEALNIASDKKVQILGRHESGVILAYKVIEKEADIVTAVTE